MKLLTIVMYHYVREIKKSQFPNLKGLEFSEFKNQIKYLKTKYNIIGYEEFKDFIINKQRLPKNPCMLTFDDGYKDHINYVLPELSRPKISAFFFPVGSTIMEDKILDINLIHAIQSKAKSERNLFNDLNYLLINNNFTNQQIKFFFKNYFYKARYDSKYIRYFKEVLQNMDDIQKKEKIINQLFKKYVNLDTNFYKESLYLNKKEIKELISNGMYVGAHGYHHKRYANLTPKQQEKDINLSLKFLKVIGSKSKNWIMCYPYGSYNSKTINIIKKKNCLAAVTVDVGNNNQNKMNLFKLNRFDTNDFKNK